MSGHCPVDVIWDERFLDYDFGEGHPFSERSRALAVKLLERARFFQAEDHEEDAHVDPLPEAGLRAFHSPQYVRRVIRESRNPFPGLLDSGDTPAFTGVFEAASRIVAGTLLGVTRSLAGKRPHTVNFAGGLHHAAPGRASGFCVFNDVGVAIAQALKERWVKKVAYVDIDAHHGDGVMYGFYSDGRVLDIDFHQDGRTLFPGSGFTHEVGNGDGKGLKVNIPLPPGAGDEALMPLFSKIVPSMIRDFRPDIMILQSGVDGHVGDPLAHLQYTPRAYRHVVSSLHGLSHEVSSGRMVLLGGGGYSPANVARVLASEAMILGDGKGPAEGDPLPSGWREDFRSSVKEEPPSTWNDIPPLGRSPWNKEREEGLLDEISHHLGMRFR